MTFGFGAQAEIADNQPVADICDWECLCDNTKKVDDGGLGSKAKQLYLDLT